VSASRIGHAAKAQSAGNAAAPSGAASDFQALMGAGLAAAPAGTPTGSQDAAGDGSSGGKATPGDSRSADARKRDKHGTDAHAEPPADAVPQAGLPGAAPAHTAARDAAMSPRSRGSAGSASPSKPVRDAGSAASPIAAASAAVTSSFSGPRDPQNGSMPGSPTDPMTESAANAVASRDDPISRAVQMLLSAAAGSASPAAAVPPGATAGKSTQSAGGEPESDPATDEESTGARPGVEADLQMLAWLSGTSASGTASIVSTQSDLGSGASSVDVSRANGSAAGSAASPALPLLPDPSLGASAALGLAAPPHTAAATHAPGAVLQAPVGTSAWVEQLGAQLTWMAHRGIESASLHVSPTDLGPIDVRISLHGRDASVWFGAAHAGTRAALEQALPQLHNLFAAQGIALSDTGVFREPPRQTSRRTATAAARAAAVREQPARAADLRSTGSLGLLDLYA
jgi:flagellar hook-length control protein FliK